MGKIQNMQQNQNDINLSYVRKESRKPKLKIKSAKDLGTLIGPNAKRYSLSPNQRNFQLKARTGITIAGLILSGALVGFGTHAYNQVKEPQAIETSIEDTLVKDDVLSRAEDKLKLIIYQDKLSLMDEAKVRYSHDSNTNSDTFIMYKTLESPNADPIEIFSYKRFNNLGDKYLTKNSDNSEIVNLINMMLDIKNKENPSQEDLRKLDTIISNTRVLDYNLNGNDIVSKTSEKEQKGFEMDL